MVIEWVWIHTYLYTYGAFTLLGAYVCDNSYPSPLVEADTAHSATWLTLQ